MRRRRPRAPSHHLVVEGVAPDDVAEVGSRLAAVAAEEARDHDARLVRRLRPLVDRRVPLRGVEALLEMRASRLRFADGTAVVVRGDAAGDVGVLAMWVRSASVPVAAWSSDADGVRLVFAPPRGRRRVSVVVTGLDQPG